MILRWWPHTRDEKVASYRLRCLHIVEALRGQGLDAGLYEPAAPPPSLLVLSKRYDAATLTAALALRERHGTQLVLDLCDNHFHVETAEPRLLERAESLRRAVAAVDTVIAASQALAEVVAQEVPDHAPVVVIGDAAEDPSTPGALARWRRPRDEIALRGLARALEPTPKPHRLVWFGNRGSPGAEGGMSDLLRLRDRLEAAQDEAPLSLTVISNSRALFDTLLSGWALPRHYLEWSVNTFSRALALHGTALIPVGLNRFTRCKTNNRVASAFLHGLNVVADSIPSYAEFGSCAVLDDWPRGLGPYLDDAAQRRIDLHAGQARVRKHYSLATIAAAWRDVLSRLAAPPAAASESSREALH